MDALHPEHMVEDKAEYAIELWESLMRELIRKGVIDHDGIGRVMDGLAERLPGIMANGDLMGGLHRRLEKRLTDMLPDAESEQDEETEEREPNSDD